MKCLKKYCTGELYKDGDSILTCTLCSTEYKIENKQLVPVRLDRRAEIGVVEVREILSECVR